MNKNLIIIGIAYIVAGISFYVGMKFGIDKTEKKYLEQVNAHNVDMLNKNESSAVLLHTIDSMLLMPTEDEIRVKHEVLQSIAVDSCVLDILNTDKLNNIIRCK